MPTASVVWPLNLRPPRVAELQETPPAVVVRTQMDAGPAKVRRRFTANVRPFSAAIDATRADVQVFDDFFLDSLKGGALPFQMTNPRTGLVADFRIVGQPTYRPMAPRDPTGTEFWRISFDLEELPGSSEVCVTDTLTGAAGTHTFARSSSITVDMTSACQDGDNFVNKTNGSKVFPWLSIAGSTSISWRFTDGSGDSTITFHKDTGWSFTFIAAHVPAQNPACGGGMTSIKPGAGNEADMPLFRHYGHPEVVTGGAGEASPAVLCGEENTNDWFKMVDAELDNDCCVLPAERARGFRMYAAACIVVP